MNRIASCLLVAATLSGLAACASVPLHYYTLVTPAEAPVVDAGTPAPSLPFELLPVSVPAQVDQPQLVVRDGGQGVLLLGGERWIAPLGDEVHDALAAYLARELTAQDVSGLPGNGNPRLRIKLDLRRFDSAPGRYALIDASWSVHALPGGGMVTCTSFIREAVGPGYDALVQGHQRALARLAAGIAAAARPLGVGQMPTCPTFHQ